MKTEVMRTAEVLKYLGISRSGLAKLIAMGKIRYSKPGGKIRYFRKADLDNYMFGKLNEADFGGLDLAQQLSGLAKETIISLCKQGLIPCWVRDGEYLFTRVELLLWVEEGREKGLLK